MKYGKIVKQFLKDDILDLSAEPKRWSKNAKTDFTRKRKLPLETLLLFLISKENDTTGWELKKFFDMKSKDVPSVSAFYQQRQKLKESVFPTYNPSLSTTPPKRFSGRLIKAAPSMILIIFPSDSLIEAASFDIMIQAK